MVGAANLFGLPITGCIQLSLGYTAEYVEAGSGDPIVIVPGLSGGIGLLEPLIEQLSQKYRVIAYQLRGENAGMFERGYDFRQMVTDLEGLITSLKLERPGLVGVSFGAAIALEYATRNAHNLSFLVVQGAGKDYQPGIMGNVAREVLSRMPLRDDNPFINQFFQVLIGGPRREGDCFDFVVDHCWQTDQSVMAHRLTMLEDYNLAGRLEKIRVPTLVIEGEKDVVVTDKEADYLAQHIPFGRLQRLKGAGHFAFVTHPEQFSDCVSRFSRVRQAS